ncbi:MAG: IclR family transcriptional regulator [Actinomycetota bacterium]|nr:IclR family transcriptional regulator [Actinomycetota bacterium]
MQKARGSQVAYPLGSVDRALRLLMLLQHRGALRVQDAAEELRVAPSTAHRLLSMLRVHGFAVQDSSRTYRPGPAMTTIAASPSRDARLKTGAHRHLDDLARATGETVHLMVLEGTGARFIDGVEGTSALRVASRIGLTLPAHVTSGGKVLLAELTRDQLAELYPGRLPLTPDAAGPELNALFRELTAVRRRGYALNNEESEQGVNAIGAAARDRSGRAVAAVVVAAPSLRLPRRAIGTLAGPVQATAAAISATLASADQPGWQPVSGSR